eukprot:77444-Chlamydomonas_euryale.AAC.6
MVPCYKHVEVDIAGHAQHRHARCLPYAVLRPQARPAPCPSDAVHAAPGASPAAYRCARAGPAPCASKS